MLNTSQLCNINSGVKAPLPLAASGETVEVATAGFPAFSRKRLAFTSRKGKNGSVRADSKSQPASTEAISSRRGQAISVTVTVQKRFDGLLSKHVGANGGPYNADDNSVGERLQLELVGTDDHNNSNLHKFYVNKVREDDDVAVYTAGIIVVLFFGTIGAVFVENEHYKEINH